MDEFTTADKAPRRVGVSEGILHMAGSAAGQVLLAQPFSGRSAFGVMAGAGVFWALLYLTLRVARVRTWFGAWDSYSFGFVWLYAAVLALMLQGLVVRLS
jgi:hypothetical protein